MPHTTFHLFNFHLNRELSEIYFSIFIRTLAISMIGIFIPIYLFKEVGYTLTKVLFFYILAALFFAFLSPFIAKISNKIGLKYSVLLSSFFFIIFYFLLYNLQNYPYNVWFVLTALSVALTVSFFWIAFHADFAKFTQKKHRGEEVGVRISFSIVIGMLGPLIGGLIITYLGFNILFIVVSLLMLASSLPLFFSKEIHEPSQFSLKNIFKEKKFKDALAYIGEGMKDRALIVIWPLFIFLSLPKYLLLGFIASAVGLFTAVFTFIVGRFADKTDKRTLIKISAISDAILWPVRTLSITFLHFFSFSVVSGILHTTLAVPFQARMYDKANKGNRLEYTVFREINIKIGEILILLISMISLSLGIAATGIGLLLHVLL